MRMVYDIAKQQKTEQEPFEICYRIQKNGKLSEGYQGRTAKTKEVDPRPK